MWNSKLVACARAYQSAILTIVEPSGYPASVRCTVQFDDMAQHITVLNLPPLASGWRGTACLLFHRHTSQLGDQHELLIKGELAGDASALILVPTGFLTGSSRQDTDRMPYAGSPLDMLRFIVLGQRKARAYLKKRQQPWTPRPWKKMLRALDQTDSQT